MSRLSLTLARAVQRGRAPQRQSRASLLAGLLRKRAAAHNHGPEELEEMLRDQIRWSLPMEQRED